MLGLLAYGIGPFVVAVAGSLALLVRKDFIWGVATASVPLALGLEWLLVHFDYGRFVVLIWLPALFGFLVVSIVMLVLAAILVTGARDRRHRSTAARILMASALIIALALGLPAVSALDFAIRRPFREQVAHDLAAGTYGSPSGLGEDFQLPQAAAWLSVDGKVDVLPNAGGQAVIFWDTEGLFYGGSAGGWLYFAARSQPWSHVWQ